MENRENLLIILFFFYFNIPLPPAPVPAPAKSHNFDHVGKPGGAWFFSFWSGFFFPLFLIFNLEKNHTINPFLQKRKRSLHELNEKSQIDDFLLIVRLVYQKEEGGGNWVDKVEGEGGEKEK